MHVLLVEDDALLGDGVSTGLEAHGFTVAWVTRAAEADRALASCHFDVVVLDLGLPDEDGLVLLRRWRRRRRDEPVLVLTARDRVAHRVDGLDAGADDYLVKPFDLNELVARLRALLRRAQGRAAPWIEYGRLRFDPGQQRVWLDQQPVSLARRERALLQALLQSRGRLLTVDELTDRVYGWTGGVESNALAVHIHNLRRKLGENLIETVRGEGYRLGSPP
ncbi:Two component transcriptional regulator, winged helix family [Alloalcanivorax dieselolei B5]|uniref:Two component transcriptional regulator, winged helix family n=1 Tax=Alcanivorax dieselolei (strain DSM 16502 / CGMCC 1.3690 / MCCC 1A00001 / B-5) TaxID=930169 RepID=K0C4U2_ALCDB|nr:response regulator [Alloalcanivorax dieselolei]AFT68369.1 Two component transcriptional regulator, winged helix family [Alloalcanivorax dieselolei B5]GGJ80675.1 DNA-binding response regulator [Alloalcanivorax dieselolei]